MAYRFYSTDNADYAHVYAFHNHVTKDDIFSPNSIKGFDAIVLESGGIIHPYHVITYHQYAYIEKTIRTKIPEMPIYLTDASPKENFTQDQYEIPLGIASTLGFSGVFASAWYGIFSNIKIKNKNGKKETIFPKVSRRIFLGALIGSAALFCTGASPKIAIKIIENSDDEVNIVWPKIVETRNNLEHSRLLTMRDAINARKIEEYVAPLIRRKLRKKPRIAMVYGAGHAGLESCLKDKKHRDIIIKEFKKKGFNLDIPDQLDVVVEMNYDGCAWHYDIRKPGLF